MRQALLFGVVLPVCAAALAVDIGSSSGTGRLPALGWNSWNEYGCDINETVFLNVARLMIDLGLKDLGYEYVNIDDCWSDKILRRDNVTHELIPDYAKFPQGIAHMVEEIHQLGLKVGIYSDAGTSTCGGFAGSLGYEDIDAATWAKWGIDYLKYDNCNVPKEWYDDWKYMPELWTGSSNLNDGQDNGDKGTSTTGLPAPAGYDWATSKTAERYRRMRNAIHATGREIQYSLCAWGHAHVEQWGASSAGGHSWRMWGDIYPVWLGQHQWSWGIMPILNHAAFLWNTIGFGAHGDWDMLEVGNGNLTLAESRSHFAFWAVLKSPLIIGTKLDGIRPEILAILANKELLAFNQDPVFGAAAAPYKWGVNPDGTWNRTHPAEFWSGKSSKGTHVFVLNTLEDAVVKEVVFADVPGLDAKKTYLVHDMWTREDLGVFKGKFKAKIETHDTAALRITEQRRP